MKVCFALDPDEDGWPPARSENVWGRPVAADEYELENVPWFVRGIAFGDRVLAERDSDGVLMFRERLAWSGHYTIRVVPTGVGSPRDQIEEIVDAFSPLGAEAESGMPAYKIVALDIPPTARLAEIKALLQLGEAEGRWGWDEGCTDSAWAAL